ncbi:hypothetical protein PENSUB_10673 [Penicillium subrubescens]|uniref:Uncharacterized protein n=1 Tax=Penicillium subrubescens TaxID=1316194 RepID=A0A1Q5T8H5_9EURO|nr:hypothetical protein PENSUB_10673 [Penicillium subrubescens]
MGTWTPYRMNGLNWPNSNYWVAYRWIPAECIEFCISMESLQRACKEKNLNEERRKQFKVKGPENESNFVWGYLWL